MRRRQPKLARSAGASPAQVRPLGGSGRIDNVVQDQAVRRTTKRLRRVSVQCVWRSALIGADARRCVDREGFDARRGAGSLSPTPRLPTRAGGSQPGPSTTERGAARVLKARRRDAAGGLTRAAECVKPTAAAAAASLAPL